MAKAKKAAAKKKVAAKTVSKKPAKKAVPAKSGDTTLVESVLTVSGAAAKSILDALADKRGTASGLKAKILDAISMEIAGGVAPSFLKVATDDLERLVHLGSPIFDAQGQDGDVFWGDPPEQDQLVWQRGTGTRRGADGEDETDVAIGDGDAASIDVYETSGEILLSGITWREPPPKTKKGFAALMKKAENAFFGEMTAYDPGDHEEQPEDEGESAAPAGVAGAIAPGAYFLGGPSREGRFEGEFSKAPKVQWARVETSTRGTEWGASITVGDGIAVGGESGFTCTIGAVDAATGETRWKLETAKTQSWPNGQIAIVDRTVYAGTNHGLHAIDAQTGKLKWLAKLSGVNGAPLVLGDTVVVGAKKGLYALSLEKNGRKKWTFPLKEQCAGNPAYRDGTIYFHGNGHLHALDAGDGNTVRWKTKAFDTGALLRLGPIALADLVIYLADSRDLASCDRATGKPVWKTSFEESLYGHGAAVSGEWLVVKDDAGRIHGLDLATGKRKWTSDGDQEKPYGIGHCGPIIAGDTVISMTCGDPGATKLVGLDLATGKHRWTAPSKANKAAFDKEQAKSGSGYDGGWEWYCTPFVANGILYATCDAGVVALK